MSAPGGLAAAAPHDTLEDTETTAEELAAASGERICGIDLEVTDDKAVGKAAREQLQGCFDWAEPVVDGMRGTHPRLEAIFDAVYAQRPER